MNNLEKAQQINKILLLKMDEVCKKYNITYYCDSGSLLGAVRHQDFIPWDDDVDVAFTRENYNKLLKDNSEAWGDDFELVKVNKLVKDSFFDMTTRLVYLGDSVPLKSYEKVKNHVPEKYKDKMVIDCFILDNAYDSKWKQLLLRLRLISIYGQCMGHRDDIDYSEYGGAKKIFVKLLSMIGKNRDLNKLLVKYDKISQSEHSKSDLYYYSNYPIPYLGVCCKKEWFRDTVQLPIGGDYFSCPVGYKEVLTAGYGDYMQLPKEERRKPEHIIIG